MKHKKLISLFVLILCIIAAGVFFGKDYFTTRTGKDYRNITDLASAYHADKEIAQALEQMKNSQEKAAVITHSTSSQRVVALTFDGLTDRTTMEQILDLLYKYNVKATFFADGLQAGEDPQTLVAIRNAGQRLGNYTFSGLDKMEKLPRERLVKEFCRAQKIIKVNTDVEPKLLKCNNTQYTVSLLQAAKACGLNAVVKNDVFYYVQQMNSVAAAENFVAQLRAGSIVSIKLSPNPEPIKNEPGKTNLTPAIDKQPGLKALKEQPNVEKANTVQAVEALLIALNRANYTVVYVEDFSKEPLTSGFNKTSLLHHRQADQGDHSSLLGNIALFLRKQVIGLFSCRTAYAAELTDNNAQEIKIVFTTEPALAYTFGGLSKPEVVDDVLGRLNHLGIKATFFVMEIEMKKYPETVRKIIENGHEIGLAIRPKKGETFDETRQSIIRGRQILREQFGVSTNLVKQPWGAVLDTTKQAVSSLGCQLIGQSVNVVQSKHKDYTSANQVMSEIFGKGVLSLARGQIVHFRMDYYTNDSLVGDLVEIIKQRKVDNIAYATSFDNPAHNMANNSQYVIKPVGEILNNTRFIYQYPVDLKNVPASLRQDGNVLNIDKHNFLAEASKRYIGNEFVNDEDRMIGFSKMETRRLDKSGLIHTNDNVIFITFDDWGLDESVNKLLYVLRKHHVPATFFVITNNVLHNPNLLRAIAMEGHNIGSHSDKHKPMAVRDPNTGRQVSTQSREEYVKDLATALQKLRSVTGDVMINGKPALTRFFRPPQMAVSKMGLEALFETGYEYIICGSCSTEDYQASSVQQLLTNIKEGVYTENGEIRKGAIVTMHMTDTAKWTPIALDILLTANEAKPDSDPSKFKVGRLSDFLIDGYSEINRRQSLKLTSQAIQK